MLRSELIPIDSVSGERRAVNGEVKRLGDNSVVSEFVTNRASILVATRSGDRDLAALTTAGGPGPPAVV